MNVTGCESSIGLVIDLIGSPAWTLGRTGSISATSTYCVAVPAMAVTVRVPSPLGWGRGGRAASSASKAPLVSRLACARAAASARSGVVDAASAPTARDDQSTPGWL